MGRRWNLEKGKEKGGRELEEGKGKGSKYRVGEVVRARENRRE